MHRRRIERIEGRITSLRERADQLLQREDQTEQRLRELRTRASEPAGRFRSSRRARAIVRAEQRVERLRGERGELAEKQIRSIMLALQEESCSTRERLDRELARLTPLEEEWERLRSMFDALEAAITVPALQQLTTHWQGELAIPEFPVYEHQGYVKPFPRQAILF